MKKVLLTLFAALFMFTHQAWGQAVKGDKPVSKPTLTNSAVALKSTTGTLRWIECYNPNASVAYVQLLDATTPVLGTTVPVISFGIAASAQLNMSFMDDGIQFINAIQAAATTTATGNTALGSPAVCNFGVY